MIKAKLLKEMLKEIPDEAVVWAHQRGTGFVFEWNSGRAWIRAAGTYEEDNQHEDEQDMDWIQKKEPIEL